MKKAFIILGIVLLASTAAFAVLIPDPLFERYHNIECWGMFADTLVGDAQSYYPEPPDPPDYLQDMRDELWDRGGEMYKLWEYADEGDVEGFNNQARVVRSLIVDMQLAFMSEGRNAYMQGWSSRGIRDDFNIAQTGLIACLEGGGEPT